MFALELNFLNIIILNFIQPYLITNLSLCFRMLYTIVLVNKHVKVNIFLKINLNSNY